MLYLLNWPLFLAQADSVLFATMLSALGMNTGKRGEATVKPQGRELLIKLWKHQVRIGQKLRSFFSGLLGKQICQTVFGLASLPLILSLSFSFSPHKEAHA